MIGLLFFGALILWLLFMGYPFGTLSIRRGQTSRQILLVVSAVVTLSACEKPVHPDDRPVSHWLKSEDACIRKTAESIIASRRAWPNEVWKKNSDGQEYLAQFDLWIGDQLYVMPGQPAFLSRNGFDANHNPWKYTAISGNLEQVLGIPKQSFKDWRVGGTLYGNIVCEWGQSLERSIDQRRYHAPTRAELIERIVNQLKGRADVLRVEVKERNDIKMAEINVITAQKSDTYAYVPRDMKQTLPDGQIAYKSISCSSSYDPDAELDISSKCEGWITLGHNNIYVWFWVYQQYLPFVPHLHDHILNTFNKSRKN